MKKTYNYKDSEERALTAVVPTATESYTPVGHNEFITVLKEELIIQGYTITGERLYTNENGNKLVGLYDVEIPAFPVFSNRDVRMMIGFRNSYDKSMSVAIVTGGTVVICGNGLIIGDMMRFVRKHTGSVNLEVKDKIHEAVSSLQENYQKMMMEVSLMKDILLTNTQKAEILGRLYFKEKLLTPRQASMVRREMYESENFSGNTLWDLYNNVTEVLKWSHPSRQIEDHIKLHKFMNQITGVVEPEDEFVEILPEEIIETGTVETPLEDASQVRLSSPSNNDVARFNHDNEGLHDIEGRDSDDDPIDDEDDEEL